MTIFADTTKEELDATIILYALFIGLAFCNQVFCIAIKNVNLRRWNVNLNSKAGHEQCKKIFQGGKSVLCEKNSRNMKV